MVRTKLYSSVGNGSPWSPSGKEMFCSTTPQSSKSLFDAVKEPSKVKPEHVLCLACKKPIHIEQWGGITKKGMYHNTYPCIKELIQ